MKPIITYERHFVIMPKRTIAVYRHWSDYVLADERPQPKPTEEELGATPNIFRCFVCLRSRGKGQLGRIVYEKRICRMCSPYVDDQSVRGLIAFDRRHGFDSEKIKFPPFKTYRKRLEAMTGQPESFKDWELTKGYVVDTEGRIRDV